MNFALGHLGILAIFALAGVLHGLTGIGITLVATAALTTIYPLSHALVLAVLPCLLINGVVFFQGKQPLFYIKKYGWLALMSFIGSLIGTKLVFILPQNILLIGVGVAILFYVVSQWLGKTITLPTTFLVVTLSGLIAGIIGGATNAMSPVLMMYLLSATHGENAKTEIVVASNLCYLVGKIAQLIILWPEITVLKPSELMLIATATGIATVALFVGFYFRKKIPSALFRQLILVILFGLAIKVMLKGFGV